MRLNRFFGNFDLSKKSLVVEDADICHQIRCVLRMQEGDQLVLCDGTGTEALAAIQGIGQGRVSCGIIESHANAAEPARRVTLYCAILKRENFELVAQKATEAGMCRLVPITTMRTVKQEVRGDRIERIIREAAEQSGRGIVPELSASMTLGEAIEDMRKNEWNCVFDLGADGLLKDAGSIPARCGVCIGPEGGFDASEIAALREAGCRVLSLGSLTLRGETAAIVASYLVAHA
jgi:16S rRNA (uracil1498-N3)-methyltransferase